VPVQDQLELIKPNGEIEFHPLNSAKGITYIGSNPKNDIVIDDPRIRPFHAFLDHRQKPARLVLLEQEAGLLSARPPELLSQLNRVEFEGYALILLEAEEQQPAVTAAVPELEAQVDAPKPASLLTIPFPDQTDDAIGVQLSTRALSVEVEETAAVYVTVTNKGEVAAEFKLEMVGLDESWVTGAASILYLQPAESQTITLLIKPPRHSSSRAGIHHCAVKVTSPAYPQRYCQQRATLTIQPYYEFSLSGLTPRQQTISWSKPSAQFTVSITNSGNTLVRFKMVGVEDEPAYTFEFQAPGEKVQLSRQVEFTLLPNETASIPIQVTAVSRLVASLSRPTHPFVITTTLAEGPYISRSVLGQVAQKALAGPGMLALVTAALVLLAVFVIINRPVADPAAIAREQAASSDAPKLASFPLPAKETPTVPDDLPAQDKSRMTYEQMFQEIAFKYHLDQYVLEAVAYQESQMNYLAVGQAMDMGMMQVIPATWNEWAPKVNVYDPFDPIAIFW
jgi:archaellum component FlaF (FlaF/FlaG flagellin family)